MEGSPTDPTKSGSDPKWVHTSGKRSAVCAVFCGASSICCREERHPERCAPEPCPDALCSARAVDAKLVHIVWPTANNGRGGVGEGGRGSASYLSCSHHPSTLIFAPTFAPTPARSPHPREVEKLFINLHRFTAEIRAE